MSIQKDDRIFPSMRIIAGIVAPILLLAFQILYFAPQTSGERFAWEIQPAMMASFMGAGYLAGAYFFLNIVFRRQWHHVRVVFIAITFFTTAMLLTTILHWERFDIQHFPFQAWFVLYVIFPPLVPFLWFRNERTDPVMMESGDLAVPDAIRLVIRWVAIVLSIITVASFIAPQLLIQVWPWELTPLTARVTSGWISLIGFGSLFLAAEKRWSAWQLALQVIAIWEALILIGGFLHVQELKTGWFNGLFISILLQLIALIGFYVSMEVRRANLKQQGNK
jgi:uncharacterized membrane protein